MSLKSSLTLHPHRPCPFCLDQPHHCLSACCKQAPFSFAIGLGPSVWSTTSPSCSHGSPGLPLPTHGDFYYLTPGFPPFQAHLQGLTIRTDSTVKPNFSAECGQSQSHLAGLSWGLDELTDCKWFPRYLAQK